MMHSSKPVLPVLILAVIEISSRKTSAGYFKIHTLESEIKALEAGAKVKRNHLPAVIVAWSIGACGMLMMVLAILDKKSFIAFFLERRSQ